MSRERRATDEDYAAMAASYETDPMRPDEVVSIEVDPAFLHAGRPRQRVGSVGAEGDAGYCVECGCPVTEHDFEGRCHALDLPALGHINDCSCPGLVLPGSTDRG